MTNLQKYRRIALLTQKELSLMICAHKDYINRLEAQNIKPGENYAKAIVNVINSKFVELGISITITTQIFGKPPFCK